MVGVLSLVALMITAEKRVRRYLKFAKQANSTLANNQQQYELMSKQVKTLEDEKTKLKEEIAISADA